MAETQKERIMRVLRCSSEEADEILRADKAIEQGKRVDFDLSPEEEKLAKKYINTHERKTDGEPKTRQRKENPTKGGIIAEIAEFLTKNGSFAYENVEITNKERQIAFTIGDDRFEITLTQKRKPKN